MIKIDLEDIFNAIITVDKKSYITRNLQGELTIKGNSIKSRRLEPFCQRFLNASIEILFDINYIRDLYDLEYNLLINREMPVNDLVKKTTLNKSLEQYKNDRNGKNNNPIVEYELAIASERKYEKGDVLSYYVVEPPKEVVLFCNKAVYRKVNIPAYKKAKIINKFNSDYDIEYYVDRLNKTTKRLLPVLGEENYKLNFPEIKLYKKDIKKLTEIETLKNKTI